jgi:hypothetical protein
VAYLVSDAITSIRSLTNDLTAASYAVSDARYLTLIRNAAGDLSTLLGTSDTWTSAAITLVPGTTEYTFPNSDYQTLTIVRRTDDRVILNKVGWEELEGLRQGGSVPYGKPTAYALYETSAQVLTMRVDRTPTEAGTLDIFFSTMATDATATSDSIAYLPRLARRALEYLVAADAVAGFTEDQLVYVKLDRSFADVLYKRGQQFVTLEKERRSSQRRTDHIQRVRY